MNDNNIRTWRAMRPEDIPLACALLKANGSQVTEEELGILDHMSTENLATDTLIALSPAGEIVAVGFVFLFQYDEKAMTGLVTGVVHTAHYRQGLGSHLLSWQVTRVVQKAHALHSYKKAGFESCWLGVDDENITNAKRIYLRLGFVQEKATRYFVRKIDDI